MTLFNQWNTCQLQKLLTISQQTFSLSDQIVNILGFVGDAVTPTILNTDVAKVATTNM